MSEDSSLEVDFQGALTRARSRSGLVIAIVHSDGGGSRRLRRVLNLYLEKMVPSERFVFCEVDVEVANKLFFRPQWIMPSVLVVDAESKNEIARLVGDFSVDFTFAWLKSLDPMLVRGIDGLMEVNGLVQKIDALPTLICFGRHWVAFRYALEAWIETGNPYSRTPRKRPFLLIECLKSLVGLAPYASTTLSGMRDAAWSEFGSSLDMQALADWFFMNHVLGETRRTVDWLSLNMDLVHSDWALGDALVPLLLQDEFWCDAGRFLVEPMLYVDKIRLNREMGVDDGYQFDDFNLIAEVICSLRIAGRAEEALRLLEAASLLDFFGVLPRLVGAVV